MSNVHVVEGGNGFVMLVCHIPAPVGNNQAIPAITYATALLRSGKGGVTRLPDGNGNGGTISSAEKTNILNGSVYERVVPFDLGNDWEELTGPQRLERLDTAYNQIVADETAAMTLQLRYYGFIR